MPIGDPDVLSTGWVRVLPGPALDVFGAVWRLANAEDGPVVGDLDDLGPLAFGVGEHPGGFDSPYDPADDPESLDDPTWAERWAEWRGYAAERDMPMNTVRDMIDLMVKVGVLHRIGQDGQVRWRTADPLPLAEDILSLSAEHRGRETALRWAHRFRQVESCITHWLLDQRTSEPLTTTTTSLAELATVLDLDIDDVRHGLTNATKAARDIIVSVDPERAYPSEPLTITVDWRRFDTERIALRFDV